MSKSYEAFMSLDTSKYLGEFVGMRWGVGRTLKVL